MIIALKLKFLFGRSKKEADGIGEEEEKTCPICMCRNAGRSQIAEAFFRKLSPRGHMTISAGTRPAGEINPAVIQVMKELGLNVSKQKSKILTEDMIRNADVRVNMGCMDKEACPTLFIHNLLEWIIEDPKGKSLERVRDHK